MLTALMLLSRASSESRNCTADNEFELHSPAVELRTLEYLLQRRDHSWVRQLSPDPDQQRHWPNKHAREVNSGHYVKVDPTPLLEPYLVAFAPEVAELLGLDEAELKKDAFVRLFSGDISDIPRDNTTSPWATPYALSIYGAPQEPRGAGKHANGYGDGRAISIAEVLLSNPSGRHPPPRMELQLKGGGTTPFCRGADGRAVLRSSVREFLASEAMHFLGVPTTRALSLIASKVDTSSRPWYSAREQQQAQGAHGGDIMQREQCAITTRVAPSFLRVGHFELYARRTRRTGGADWAEVRRKGREELAMLARHALYREYVSGDITISLLPF
jgi:uncharacterized protein YdiU (UPF0061 family)